jgi:hypothetical protein
MSYWDISEMSFDPDLSNREQAAAAQEIPVGGMDPRTWQADNSLRLAASPGWSEAWASAVAGGVPRPGKDPGVITDGMILSAVQALIGAPS